MKKRKIIRELYIEVRKIGVLKPLFLSILLVIFRFASLITIAIKKAVETLRK